MFTTICRINGCLHAASGSLLEYTNGEGFEIKEDGSKFYNKNFVAIVDNDTYDDINSNNNSILFWSSMEILKRILKGNKVVYRVDSITNIMEALKWIRSVTTIVIDYVESYDDSIRSNYGCTTNPDTYWADNARADEKRKKLFVPSDYYRPIILKGRNWKKIISDPHCADRILFGEDEDDILFGSMNFSDSIREDEYYELVFNFEYGELVSWSLYRVDDIKSYDPIRKPPFWEFDDIRKGVCEET